MKLQQISRHWPGFWVPTLYFTQGLPYTIITSLSLIMYKRLGLSNEETALYVSWLSLPWMLKPFWSPIIDFLGKKRTWILLMQLFIGAGLACVGLTLPLDSSLKWSFVFFFLAAFSSATHDIAADGFYLLELSEKQQSIFVGIRSTFFRLSMFAGSGLLVILAGALEAYLKIPTKAWAWTLFISSIFFIFFSVLHNYLLPRSPYDQPQIASKGKLNSFWNIFIDFFKKPHIGTALLFMMLYRLPEAMLVKITPLFLLDPNNIEKGGLGLTTAEIGFSQGHLGVLGIIFGGILGGIAIGTHGFKRWLWAMVLSISIPNAVYIALAYYQPTNMFFINSCIFIEQLGYGFGFSAYMLYLLYFAQGKHQVAHYAFCTGFMTLGMMLPGMVAGYLQESLGYLNFFILIMCLCPITFIVAAKIKINPDFGKSSTKSTESSSN